MINLLPKFDKKQIHAGLTNSLLIRYTVIMAIILVLMATEFLLTYLYIQHTRSVAEQAISDNQSKGREILQKRNEVDSFRSNLSTAKQILDKRVDYSAITLEIASLVPSGVIVEQLTIDPTTFGTSTPLTVKSKDESAARNLKKSLENSSYFDDVHFDTLAFSPEDESGYPYTATLSITLKKELLSR